LYYSKQSAIYVFFKTAKPSTISGTWGSQKEAPTTSKPEYADLSKRPVRVRIPFSYWQGRAARLPTESLAWNKRRRLEGNDGTEMAEGDSGKYRYMEGMSTVADRGKQWIYRGDEYSGGSWEAMDT